MSRLEQLGQRYRDHHRSSRSPEFVFGGDERAHLFRRIVAGPGKDVLDVGCRYGALTRAYLAGNNVVGLDVDKEALERAAALGVTTVWADAEDPLPFETESFDVVVMGELLEHLREPSLLIEEAHRVLRPGGTLVGSVPNAYRLKNRLRFLAGRAPEADPTHLHLFRPADLRQALASLDDVQLFFVAGRFLRLHPRLFANIIVFGARTPSAGRRLS